MRTAFWLYLGLCSAAVIASFVPRQLIYTLVLGSLQLPALVMIYHITQKMWRSPTWESTLMCLAGLATILAGARDFIVVRLPESGSMSFWEGGQELGLDLCRKPKARPVFDGAERAKRDLDPLLDVPADVRVDRLDELVGSGVLTLSRIEQLVLEPTEKPSQAVLFGLRRQLLPRASHGRAHSHRTYTTRTARMLDDALRQNASFSKRRKISGGNTVLRSGAATFLPTACKPGIPVRSSNSSASK